ncbi:hypothetical protein LCGC14_0498440 [marine sediment metagenome]|uniref:Cytidyltransferase-like domain-containing protein n=1 Tax=marine sediment metagenome TaxID=412755 RepID=A0A0F9S4G1_9ZZZZ
MPKFPVIVMVSGHFDPLHDGHLSYLKQAIAHGDAILCVVSSDAQLMMKKGNVNIPQRGRSNIVRLILEGMRVLNVVVVNQWDKETTLVAEALRVLKPAVFFRGGDKTIEDMPPEERQVCDELGIEIRHAVLEHDRHGARMVV